MLPLLIIIGIIGYLIIGFITGAAMAARWPVKGRYSTSAPEANAGLMTIGAMFWPAILPCVALYYTTIGLVDSLEFIYKKCGLKLVRKFNPELKEWG